MNQQRKVIYYYDSSMPSSPIYMFFPDLNRVHYITIGEQIFDISKYTKFDEVLQIVLSDLSEMISHISDILIDVRYRQCETLTVMTLKYNIVINDVIGVYCFNDDNYVRINQIYEYSFELLFKLMADVKNGVVSSYYNN